MSNDKVIGAGPRRVLTLFDAICIIVGTIIGAGIFQTAPDIARFSGGVFALVGLWAFGGLLTIIGALCFAELTTRNSDLPGGDYGFLKLAFGRPVAFMFAWATFWIIRPGNIGAMAITFATYFDQVLPSEANHGQIRIAIYAMLSVIILSAINLIGLRQGKTIQNLLTAAKVTGLIAIVLIAVISPAGSQQVASQTVHSAGGQNMWLLAMVFIMFSFGGWNDLSFIATEIKNPQKNLFRALIFGTMSVTVIYVIVNVAFVIGLGFSGVAESNSVATDVVRNSLGPENWIGKRGAQIIAALICVSCLGAINGIIITSPRIYYAAGRDFRLIRMLGNWNQRRDQPWLATAVQAVVTMGLFSLCFQYENPFTVIVIASAPFFWAFLGLTGLTVIVLRGKAANSRIESGFRVPLFPLEPLILATACFLMAYSSTRYLILEGYWTAGLFVAGVMVLGIGLGLILRSDSDERQDSHRGRAAN